MTAGRRSDEDGGAARQRGVGALVEVARARAGAARTWADDLLQRYRGRPLVDLTVGVIQRDREAAGTVLGSALAFRLFLFFVPLLLFVVGLAGFLSDIIRPQHLESAGIAGALAEQINGALTQPTSTRWIAVITGFIGMASTGRTLSKALTSASCLAWRLPVSTRASPRLIGAIVGLLVGMGVVVMLVNRVRQQLGLPATGLSFLAALAVYTVAWMILSSMLPRPRSDAGVLLPGAALVAGTITGLQAISQLYLPGRFSRASELYGALGATVVTLGWFFIVGRVIVLSMVLDAAIHERFSSISRLLFALPVLRQIAHRSPWIRRRFALEDPPPTP